MIKLLSIIIFICVFISCSKESESNKKYSSKVLSSNIQPGGGFKGVVSYDDSTAKNLKGVRSTFDVVKFKGNAYNQAVWVLCYIRTSGIYGTIMVQHGYAKFYNVTAPFADINSGGNLNVIVLNNPPLKFNQKQIFSIYNVVGTTKWRTQRDGVDCLEFDILSEGIANNPIAGIEVHSSTGINFPTINYYPALQALKNNNWLSVTQGQAIYVCPNVGIEGKIQNPTLKSNEINIGTKISTNPIGFLWY